MMQTFKDRMRASQGDGDLKTRLSTFLLSYRTMPHSTTGKSPAELLYQRRLATRLDRLRPDPRAKMEWEQWKQKAYHDAGKKTRLFQEGEPVWVPKELERGWRPGVIDQKTGQ